MDGNWGLNNPYKDEKLKEEKKKKTKTKKWIEKEKK